MDCERAQSIVLDVLAGAASDVPIEEVRQHLNSCDRCRTAAPQLAADWVTVKLALTPEPSADFWQAMEAKVLAIPGSSAFPTLRAKLESYRNQFVRIAAAERSTERRLSPIVHRLEIEGADLDLVCHMKDEALVRLSVVERTSHERSPRLDGSSVRLPSGKAFPIRAGGAEIPLQDLIEGLAFTIARPDGTQLRLREP